MIFLLPSKKKDEFVFKHNVHNQSDINFKMKELQGLIDDF
jgi:hypothetical protein